MRTPLDPSSNESGSTQPDASIAPTSFVRRHRLATVVTATLLAAAVVSGFVAWGVGTAVAASYQNATSVAAVPMASAAPNGKEHKNGAAAASAKLHGTVQSISGSVWTITTEAGASQQITITAATYYGNKKAPATAADFAVGTEVLISKTSGTNGDTAVRIIAVHGAAGEGGTPTASPSATPGT